MLSDFSVTEMFQLDLFKPISGRTDAQQLMTVLDNINQCGVGAGVLAAQGIDKQWAMKREYLSPAYTTCWSELPKVR